MPVVAVTGDGATTTSVALAAAAGVSGNTVLVEADPTGGDLAAWLDLPQHPSLSTAVTRVHDGSWAELERLVRTSPSGLRVLPAPFRTVEAERAVVESARDVVPALAAAGAVRVVVDVGSGAERSVDHPFLALASAVVVVHRQAPQSPRAAAVRLQRLGERVSAFGGTGVVVVAVVGDRPFPIAEIEAFVAGSDGTVPVVPLADDPLAAAVLGGRPGVSPRRLARLPLLRTAGALLRVVEALAGTVPAADMETAP